MGNKLDARQVRRALSTFSCGVPMGLNFSPER